MKDLAVEEDYQEVFVLDESDITQEITVDEEDLPDADNEPGSDGEAVDEADDSVHIFSGHTGELYTVACSPTDGTLVATGGGDDKGFLWRMGQGDIRMAFELQGHKDSVSSLAFSSDGNLLASGGFDGLVQIWDTTSGSLKCAFEGSGKGIGWVRWHPREHLVLAGEEDPPPEQDEDSASKPGEDCAVWMWDADTSSCLYVFSGHSNNVTCGDFTPDGETICTGSKDGTLRIWNPITGKSIHVVGGHPYHTKGLTCLTITSDSTLALTGSEDHSVRIVNIATGRVVSSLIAHSDTVECVALAKSFPLAATGGNDQTLIVWDLRHSSPRCTCEHEEGVVTCLLWLGESTYLATGCFDGKVRVWDSLSGKCVKTFSGHSDAIQSLAVSANGEFLVSVSLDKTARVFKIE